MTLVQSKHITGQVALYRGDSAEILAGIPQGSVHLTVTSPPFSQLYTYSATERDLGNAKNDAELMEHFGYVIRQLLRVTMPGRCAAIHVMDIPAMLVRDGYIGLKDFSGDVIRAFIGGGWTFDGRVPIDKNQQAQSIRTHSKALTMTQLEKDRSWLRPALPDYVLKFRKAGNNPVPVIGHMTRDEWIEWANPTWLGDDDRCLDGGAFSTWYGIHETDTLQYTMARHHDDERHIAPLQLGTIERCVRLWSNPGEAVLDPFAGIGSVGHVALRLGRKFVGVELKDTYYEAAARNLIDAEREVAEGDLFSRNGITVPGRGEQWLRRP